MSVLHLNRVRSYGTRSCRSTRLRSEAVLSLVEVNRLMGRCWTRSTSFERPSLFEAAQLPIHLADEILASLKYVQGDALGQSGVPGKEAVCGKELHALLGAHHGRVELGERRGLALCAENQQKARHSQSPLPHSPPRVTGQPHLKQRVC